MRPRLACKKLTEPVSRPFCRSVGAPPVRAVLTITPAEAICDCSKMVADKRGSRLPAKGWLRSTEKRPASRVLRLDRRVRLWLIEVSGIIVSYRTTSLCKAFATAGHRLSNWAFATV